VTITVAKYAAPMTAGHAERPHGLRHVAVEGQLDYADDDVHADAEAGAGEH